MSEEIKGKQVDRSQIYYKPEDVEALQKSHQAVSKDEITKEIEKFIQYRFHTFEDGKETITLQKIKDKIILYTKQREEKQDAGKKEIVNEKETELEKIRNKVIVYDENGHLVLKETLYNLSKYFLETERIITFNDTDEIYIYDDGVYSPRGDKKLSKTSQEILKEITSNNIIKELLGHIKRLSYQKREKLSEPKNKICLQKNILNLDNLTIEQHNPSMIFFNKLPVNYDKNTDCPLIKKFLSEIVSEEDITLLQEFAGYCLFKEYFIHKAFMLVGGGANGKSTFLNLLKSFLGIENISSVSLQKLEVNRFSIASLFGKLANINADLPDKALSGTSNFKSLVGQDTITGERKFKDEFDFENYAKLIFSCNKIPKSPEDTDAFFRRWVIINFPNQFFNNADKHLIKKLTTPEELSGFLNFAIEGLRRLIEQGDFTNTKSLNEVREKYIRMSDSIEAFVMDKIKIKSDGVVIKQKLYTAYADYCRNMNYPIEAENTFHRELPKKIRIEEQRKQFDVDGKKQQIRCWVGIALNNNEKEGGNSHLN